MRRFVQLFLLICLHTFSCSGQTANFTADSTGGCAPLIVHFTNTSSTATNYFWDLGNGVTTPLTDPSTSYIVAGTYTVTLTAYNGTSSDVHTMIINVDSASAITFVADDTTVCPGVPIAFTYASVGSTTSLWNFGDGTSSTSDSPFHSFSTPGYHNITLAATNNRGCQSLLTRSSYIFVYTPPVPNFSVNDTHFCSIPGHALFLNNTSGSSTLTYAWSFGDGGTSTLLSPVHDYTVHGTFPVTLHVTDGNGCSDSLSLPSYISVANLIAGFSRPDTGCLNAPVTFNNTSSTHISSKWLFGDGDTSTSNMTAVHTYSATGTYTVSLIVFDGICYDTISRTIGIITGPVASYAISPVHPCPAASPVTYIATAPTATSVTWAFAGGASASGDTIVQNYTANGYHATTMTAVNNWGCITKVIDSFLQYDLYLGVAGFHPSNCVPLNVPFSVEAYCMQPDSPSYPHTYPYNIASYNWTFGDGSASSSAATPAHTYTAAGIYYAKITATTANGCITTDSIKVLAGTPPTVTFKVAPPTHVCAKSAIVFSVDTNDVANAFVWSYGDGAEDTVYDPTNAHQYTLPGDFTPTLIGLYNGCPGAPYTTTTHLLIDSPSAFFNVNYQCTAPVTNVSFADGTIGASSFVWLFGDGDTSTSQAPTHNYPSVSSYEAKLATYNVASGCRDTFTRTVHILGHSTDFFADDTTICKDGTVNFTSVITGSGISGYQWAVNDTVITTSTLSLPFSHTFIFPGRHTIVLNTMDDHGCWDTARKTNYITVAKPATSFTAPIPNGCTPITVNFTDQSTDIPGIPLTNYEWFFGDGTTVSGTASSASHTYTIPGIYDVQEIVTDSLGCMDTLKSTALVNVSHADATFTASSRRSCVGTNITFTRLYTGTTGSQWFFGDGDTSTAPSPVHAYSATGTYTVMQVVTDPSGCSDTVRHIDYITITKPHASFTMSDTIAVCPPLLVTFSNSSSGAANYNWTFGDGNSSVGATPNNVYATPGYFTVRLTAIDTNACTDTAIGHARLYGYIGVFSTAPSVSGCSPLTINFNTTLSNVTTIVWDFADGTTSPPSLSTTATHIYSLPGAYLPKLILTDSNGCQTASPGADTIKVNGVIPGFIITPANLCLGSPFTCVDTSGSLWSSVTTRLWTFRGDSSTLVSPSFTADTVGTYAVTLYVTNDSGCTGSATNYVTVSKPVASFTAPSPNGCTPHAVTFTDNSTGIPGIHFTNFEWSFGDGASSSGAAPVVAHTYTAPGIYDVQEIVTDSLGCMDTAITTALVNVSNTDASFTANDLHTCIGSTIAFTRLYPGTTGSQWFFGDGGVATVPSPTHSYTAAGTYTVMHIVTDPSGCIDTARYVNYITITKPHASFTMSDTVICAPLLVTFASTGSGAASYAWDFGDGHTSSATTPNNLYSLWGYLPVTLIVTDTNSCADTAIRHIRVRGATGTFTATPTLGCVPLLANFSATVSHAASIVWDFADGVTSAPSLSPTAAHTYSLPGRYLPKLILTDSFGCHTTIPGTDTIKVDRLIPGFTVNSATLCRGAALNCTDTSSSYLSAITSRLWTFRSFTGASATPSFIADTVGTFAVTLQVSNASGCTGTATKNISISGPTVSFNAPSPGGCIPHTVNFIDQSTDVAGVSFINYTWSFGDGSVASGTAASAAHTYTATGIYDVQEIVTNSRGCSDTMISTALINVSLADASFTADVTHSCIGSAISFTRLYPGTTGSLWSFGDGTTSTIPSPVHVYTDTGRYTVTHIVTDPSGCADTARYVKYISVTKPRASFGMNHTVICAPQSVTFINGSSGAASYSWDFGDGNSSTATAPTHVYTQPGYLPVTLIAADSNGCTDTAVRYIRVRGATGYFTTTPNHGCAPLAVTFIIYITRDYTDTVVFHYGDGNTLYIPYAVSTAYNIYSLPGAYFPKVLFTDSSGCQTTITSTDTIKVDKVNTGFIMVPEHLCKGADFTCTDTSVSYWSAITTRNWTFMGDTSTSVAPSFNADTLGSYAVSLTIKNASGCADTEIKTINVYPAPTRGIIVGDTTLCQDASIILTDSVFGGSWSTLSGAVATFIPVDAGIISVTGVSPGNTVIRYVVTNGFCSDTATKSIKVLGIPNMDTIIGQSKKCSGAQFTLADSASGGHWTSSDPSIAAIDSTYGTVNTFTAGTTTITYTIGPDSNGCSSSAYLTLTVSAQPTFVIDSNISQVLCNGNADGKIEIKLTDALPPVLYLWSTGGTDSVISGLAPGRYTLDITELSTQCTVTDTFHISQPDSIAITSSVTNDHCHKNIGIVHVDATGGTQPFTYMWSNIGAGGPEITGLNSGDYTVIVTDMNNCIKTSSATVADDTCFGIMVPDAITPNGDGINDTWVIEALSLYPDNSVHIFDKWGDLMYEKTDYKNDWAGTGKSGPLPDGTYFYLIKLNAKNIKGGADVFTGTILLKR